MKEKTGGYEDPEESVDEDEDEDVDVDEDEYEDEDEDADEYEDEYGNRYHYQNENIEDYSEPKVGGFSLNDASTGVKLFYLGFALALFGALFISNSIFKKFYTYLKNIYVAMYKLSNPNPTAYEKMKIASKERKRSNEKKTKKE